MLSFDGVPVTAPSALAAVSMGEGNTPTERIQIGDREVTAKLELDAPTGSFKDRGAAVLIAAAVDLGATKVVADSSGNAGIAIATYARKAELECEVFVPAATSLAQVGRISEAGARVRAVKGTREDAATAAMARVDEIGAFYASHVWNPWFFEGTKHFVLELHEQLGQRLPDVLVLPVGNGTLVLGAWRAMQELGAVAPIVGVQAVKCAPVAAAFAAGNEHVDPVVDEGTIASGIAIAAPVRGAEILEVVRATGGRVVTVTDEEILLAVAALAGNGLRVEPTAAAPAAAVAAGKVETSGDGGDLVALPVSAGRRAD